MSDLARITSHANPRIKAIKKLRERKVREASGVFFVEGLRHVIETANYPSRIQSVFFAPELLSSSTGLATVENLRSAGVEILEVSAEVFRDLSAKDGPTGLAAVLYQAWLPIDSIDLNQQSWWVALDSIADPGNLGTILRTCDAVGVNGVILLDHCTDPYDPTSVRGSMGSVLTQQIVKAEWHTFLAWKRKQSVALIGTSDKAKSTYTQQSYPRPLVVLMGSEREGLGQDRQLACDAMVSIPMQGQNDSLNLAVATGLILYEVQARYAGRKEWRR